MAKIIKSLLTPPASVNYAGMTIVGGDSYTIPSDELASFQKAANLRTDILAGTASIYSDQDATELTGVQGEDFLIDVVEKDSNGRPIFKQAIAQKGAVYLALGLNLKAFSITNTIRCKNHLGVDYLTTVKWFDAEYGGNEIVAPTQNVLDITCKRMEITLDANVDFELVEGQTKSATLCPYDCYMDVANGFVALGDAYTKSFVECANLADTLSYKTDGRSPKMMFKEMPETFQGVPANVFKMSLRRPVASVLPYSFSFLIQYYRL